MELAREKSSAIEFEHGDALDLPYADGEFDASTVGFGARNFADLDAGLAEMARVVRPGGPRGRARDHHAATRPPLSWFFHLWFDRIVPVLGRLAGDPDAYAYLPTPSSASQAPTSLPPAWRGPGSPDVRYVITGGRHHRDPRRHRPGRVTAPARRRSRPSRRRSSRPRARRSRRSWRRPKRGSPRSPRARRRAGAAAARARCRPAASGCGRCCVFLCAGEPGPRRTRAFCAPPRRRAPPHGDARPRRRPRPRAAAPRPPHRLRGPAAGRSHRRPATCSSRARSRSSSRGGSEQAVRALSRASSALAAAS